MRKSQIKQASSQAKGSAQRINNIAPLGTHRPITLSLVTGIQLLKETRCFELRNNICIGEASCILSLFIISPQKFIEIKVFQSV